MKRRDLDCGTRREASMDSSMKILSTLLYTIYGTILSFPGIGSDLFKLDINSYSLFRL